MAGSAVVEVVRRYLAAVREAGIHASRGILFGSWARGNPHPDSDIDILVIAPEFDRPSASREIDILWELRATTDSRIEPIPVGEREWEEDDAIPIIEIARREGEQVVAG